MNEDLPGDEVRVRHVLDIESIERDPEVQQAFRDLIGYLVSRGTNIKFRAVSPDEVVDTIWDLLKKNVITLVCYTDPSDALAWVFEPGSKAQVLPIDISLN
jgi:hypothetical protein